MQKDDIFAYIVEVTHFQNWYGNELLSWKLVRMQQCSELSTCKIYEIAIE